MAALGCEFSRSEPALSWTETRYKSGPIGRTIGFQRPIVTNFIIHLQLLAHRALMEGWVKDGVNLLVVHRVLTESHGYTGSYSSVYRMASSNQARYIRTPINVFSLESSLIGARMCLVRLEVSHLSVRFRTPGLQTPTVPFKSGLGYQLSQWVSESCQAQVDSH